MNTSHGPIWEAYTDINAKLSAWRDERKLDEMPTILRKAK